MRSGHQGSDSSGWRSSYGYWSVRFTYKAPFRQECGYGRQFGVMADEVECVIPEAVSLGANGYKVVDYGMLGISLAVH